MLPYTTLLESYHNKAPYLILLTLILYAIGLYTVFFNSPPDYLQGEFIRIMYIHVPCAWLSLGIYVLMAFASFIALVWNYSLADLAAFAAAPIGLVLTFICLATGSIWGKPIWGTWWVWDARLTSMLILFLLYIGYILVWDFNIVAARSAASINLIGVINIPIIKFSVNLWGTLHQPASIIKSGGIAVDSSMLPPLLVMFAATSMVAAILWLIRLEYLITVKKINRALANEEFVRNK